MKTFRIFLILPFYFIGSLSFAQWDNINFKTGDYTFKTKYDTNTYSTSFKIYKDGVSIFNESYDERITDIKEYDLNNDGRKEILVDMYSGGAHCCTSLYLGMIANNKFKFTDTLYWGNAYYSVEDINKDGKFEIAGSNDMFAYAFTNYAESKFPLLIYKFAGNKFVNVTSDYKEMVNEQLNEFAQDLKSFTDTGFQCPENNEDTFNSDAGSVKTILAAMVADYFSLGEVNKGYDLIDSVYKCTDKDKFREILKSDYKLK